MIITAFDPGVTTGVAVYGLNEPYYNGIISLSAYTDPWVLGQMLNGRIGNSYPTDVFLVENFVGGGYRTKEAITTLKLLGFIEHTCAMFEKTVIVRPPQVRIYKVTKAKELMREYGYEPNPHKADALAHVLSYLDEITAKAAR